MWSCQMEFQFSDDIHDNDELLIEVAIVKTVALLLNPIFLLVSFRSEGVAKKTRM